MVPACEDMAGTPPVDLVGYDRMRQKNPSPYPDNTIFAYNLRRVCDAGLPVEARLDSLQVATRLGADNPETVKALVDVVKRAGVPKKLHYGILEFVLRRGGDPAVAEYAVGVLDDQNLPADLRDAVLGWLTQNARPEVLAQVVKLWGQETSVTSPNEPRYRHIVERISGKTWEEALLAGIDSPAFFARGSAMEILLARVDENVLRRMIEQTTPASVPMAALREFLTQLDYLPSNKADFMLATTVYRTRGKMLGDAAELNSNWRKEAGYRFVIRDFHLLARLARDPLRKQMDRSELIGHLSRVLAARRHVQRRSQGDMPTSSLMDSFASQAAGLTMADLWDLYLLDEMLSRPRVALALKVMADCDLADKRSAWGGLVFYESGRAEAKLYPPAVKGHGDDTRYAAGADLEAEAGDSLCRFHAHFEKVNNAGRAGPDADDLRHAANENFYGLVLTGIDKDTFTAHCYKPNGVVVSLGTFQFGARGQ